MLGSITTGLTLLALAGATPVPQAASSSQLSRSKGYDLRIQLLDPAKDLDPPVDGQYLSTYHVGAGLNVAVAGAPRDPSYSFPPYYSNGTAEQGWVSVLNDLGTSFPWGVSAQNATSFDVTYPGEHDVDINVGGGSNGIHVAKTGDSVALAGLAPGNFAVCNRFIGYARSNLTVVKYVYEGETLPEDCVGVQFTAYCSELEDLPEGSEWTHDFVQEVDCVVPA
ncbi:hypothetical protein M426DRAFT_323249 [Hypoxylon sp. CI-4A]|nr:hypothetical protein M426DRAFT_323249 [Hypoxylon sp. CI-4A]